MLCRHILFLLFLGLALPGCSRQGQSTVSALGGESVSRTTVNGKTVERITQCGSISVFDGRIYRMAPGTDHYDSWHDDTNDNRLVGMSVNLGSLPYLGGVFQLRKNSCEEILCEVPNVVQGDAILFRISPELKHRITPVQGTQPKTAFAGWFRSAAPDFFSELVHSAAHQYSCTALQSTDS